MLYLGLALSLSIVAWLFWSPFELCLDLLQSFAFGLRDEEDGEDYVERTTPRKQPEGPCIG